MILLIQYVFFSLFVWNVYSADVAYKNFPSDGKATLSDVSSVTLFSFLADILDVTDLWYSYSLKPTSGESDLNTPLV